MSVPRTKTEANCEVGASGRCPNVGEEITLDGEPWKVISRKPSQYVIGDDFIAVTSWLLTLEKGAA